MGNHSRIQLAVFDLDDTLYPERQYVRSGYHAVAEHLRRQLGRQDPFDTWLWNRFLCGKAQGTLDAMNEHFGLQLRPEAIGELVRVYREHIPAIEPYGGMIETLGRLREWSRIGLLTDGFLPAQKLKVQSLKIERFFDAMVFTEELGREFWKPSHRGFEALRDRFGADDSACAYVADNPAKDFVAPNEMGWRSIQFRHPMQIHADNPVPANGRPQMVVGDSEGLCQALRAGVS